MAVDPNWNPGPHEAAAHLADVDAAIRYRKRALDSAIDEVAEAGTSLQRLRDWREELARACAHRGIPVPPPVEEV